ncbi:MAG: nuclear transport factor 2 family protein [Gammaproteobacteria bacterium]|nr:nuclear transport factor 2 family protein [Gammaproteobacteria bacterium]
MCTLAVLGLLALSGPAWSQTGDSAEKTVTANEMTWLQSQKTNNPDLVAPLLAEKFVQTDEDGKVTNKSEMLATARKTKWTSAEYEDLHVVVVGSTAVATGGFKGTGTGAEGKAINAHVRWTDTWVKMPDGKWQCLASQDGNVKQ